jgi:hypothetical protein
MAGTPSGDGSSIVRMVCLGKMLPSVGVTPCFWILVSTAVGQ